MRITKEFQRQIINSLLKEDNFLGLYIDLINPQYFEYAEHSDIVNSIVNFYKKYNSVPSIPELVNYGQLTDQQIVSELSHIDKMQLPHSTEFIGDKIVEYAQIQSMRIAHISSEDHIMSGDVKQVKKIWDDALLVGVNRQDLGIDFFSDEGFDKRLYSMETLNTCPTIWPTINKIIGGGGFEGELYTVLSPPNGGKSTVLCNIGIGGMLAGKLVVHVSTEMSDVKTALRYDSRITGVPRLQLMSDYDNYAKLISDSRKLYKGELIIKSYPPNSLTATDLYGYLTTIRRVKQKEIGLIIVDYADEMAYEKSRFNTREDIEIGNVYAGLRSIASHFSCPVWTASQAKRHTSDYKKWTEWKMGDVSDSWDKVKKSDVIAAFMEEYFVIIKNRDNGKPQYPIPVKTSFKTHKIVEPK